MDGVCGTYVGVGECVHGAGIEICRKGYIWMICKICFVYKLAETFSVLTLSICALGYCTVLQCLVCYCECGSPSVPVTAVS